MADVIEFLKVLRKQLGITQVELAHQSGVSLPSIQNLEAGNGNPSIETLQALAGSIGLELSMTIKPAHWDALAYLGAPLTTLSTVQSITPQLSTLLGTLREACVELHYSNQVSDRERKLEAVQALLLALEEHFPKIFKKYCSPSTLIMSLKSKTITGKLIKLKRIAVARLAEYL